MYFQLMRGTRLPFIESNHLVNQTLVPQRPSLGQKGWFSDLWSQPISRAKYGPNSTQAQSEVGGFNEFIIS